MIHGVDGGLHILDCFGKYNIHRFMNFLSRLGVQHAVLHDEDSAKDENAELNRLIQDSRHDELTFSIEIVPGNLEKMLDIKKTNSHRKPQHVLYQYERGNIDAKKIAEFCALVRASIPS
jgi:predicted ATP-dependent endonuclease of OLD family